MLNERWKSGRLSTTFLAEEFPAGFASIIPEGETARTMAAVAAAVDNVLGERKRRISGQQSAHRVTREKLRCVQLGDNHIKLTITRADLHDLAGSQPSIGEKPHAAQFEVRFAEEDRSKTHLLISQWKPGDLVWSGTVDRRPVSVQVRPILNGFELFHHGVEARAYVYTEREAKAAHLMPRRKSTDSGKSVRCPMPGLVVSIAVAEGQEVKAGETLAIVEAMKMENILRADRDGVVRKIHVKQGDSLAVDDIILEFA
jgi:propionyl-CoA carboxylase alpha chain